jgi:hypothetical protein
MHIDLTFSALLGDLYQGPIEDPPWQSFLSSVREVLGAHLRAVSVKIGVTRQSGLMRLILNSVAPFAGEKSH